MRIFYYGQNVDGEVETKIFPDTVEFFEKLASIPEDESIGTSIAPSHPREAIGLLRQFAVAIKNDQTPPRLLMWWLAWSIDHALNASDPSAEIAKALCLTMGQPGRQREEYKHQLIYDRMKELVAQGVAVLRAAHSVGEEFAIHEANVQKIYYIRRRWENEIF